MAWLWLSPNSVSRTRWSLAHKLIRPSDDLMLSRAGFLLPCSLDSPKWSHLSLRQSHHTPGRSRLHGTNSGGDPEHQPDHHTTGRTGLHGASNSDRVHWLDLHKQILGQKDKQTSTCRQTGRQRREREQSSEEGGKHYWGNRGRGRGGWGVDPVPTLLKNTCRFSGDQAGPRAVPPCPGPALSTSAAACCVVREGT